MQFLTGLSCCSSFSGFAAGIYTTNSPEAVYYVAEDCTANIIVVENKLQLQKVLKVEDNIVQSCDRNLSKNRISWQTMCTVRKLFQEDCDMLPALILCQ